MKTRPWWFYNQSGVIPYRRNGDHLEVLLITSRRRSRWIIPKGVVDPGNTPVESACKEAYEEAGVTGSASSTHLGEYSYDKWGGTCSVKVYLMRVDKILDTWPEKGDRTRRWMTIEAAAGAVKETQLKEIILSIKHGLE